MPSFVSRLALPFLLRSARRAFSYLARMTSNRTHVCALVVASIFGGSMASAQTSVPSSPLYDFGTVAVGSSVTQRVTFTETSPGYHDRSLVTTQGVTNRDFQVSVDNCQFSLATGSQCYIDVTFAPKFPGDRYGGAVMMNQGGGRIGTAYLHGVGSGPQGSFRSSAATAFTPFPVLDGGFCSDSFGNLYFGSFAQNGTYSLLKTPADGVSSVTTIATGLNHLASVSLDGAGNVYAVEYNTQTQSNRLLEFILQAGGNYAQTTLLSGDASVVTQGSIYVDAAGDITYTHGSPATAHARLTLSGTTYTSTDIPSLSNVSLSSFDAYGNAYSWSESSNGSFTYRYALTGTTYAAPVQISSNVAAFGVAADANGNLFLADSTNHRVVKYALSSGVYALAWTSSSLPSTTYDLALDAVGDLYVSTPYLSSGGGLIYKFQAAGVPTLNFVNTGVGATSTDSPQTITVENTGTLPLIFATPTTGNNPSIPTNFAYSASSTCPELTTASSPFTLTAGAQCTQIFSFVPTVSGSISGTVVNIDNNLNASAATQNETLVGFGLNSTATSLSASPFPAVPTQTVVLTATVSPTAGATGGYVVFSDNGVALSGSVNISGATATYSIPSISAANHIFTAAFTPANPALYTSSTSNYLYMFVQKQIMGFTSTLSTIPYSTSTDTLSASFTYVGPTAPTGAITVSVSGVITNAIPTCTGSSSPIVCTYVLNTASLVGGAHTVFWNVAADANYYSISRATTLNVSTLLPVLVVAAAGSIYNSTQPVSGTLSYSGSGVVPTGAVSFLFDTNLSIPATCTGASSPRTCTATAAAAALSGGARSVRMYYAGDTNYTGNVYSPTTSFTVSPEVLTITASSPTIVYGTSTVLLTITVPYSGAYLSTFPVFSVDGGANITPSCGINSTAAICTYSYPSASLTTGTHTYVATQAPTANYFATPGTGTITVTPAAETINFPQPAPVTYASGLTSTLGATSTSGLPITYTVLSGPASVFGSILSYTGPGVVTVQAAQAGNSNYNAATSVSVSITVFTPQTITFPQPATVSYGATTLLGASASSGLAVLYSVVSGPATITGSTLTYSGAGTVVVSASQAGNATYSVATTISVTIIVNPAAQIISFAALTTPVVYGVSPIALVATSSSGIPVTFSILSGSGTVSGGTLSITGIGSVVVAADQAGNGNYSAAAQVTQTIVITPVVQIITFAAPVSPVAYGSGTIALVATGGASGNPIMFNVVSGPGTVSGATLTPTGPGTITITANQSGSANYSAATAVSRTVVVNLAAQTITFTPPASPLTYPAGAFTLSATSNTATPIVFSLVSGPGMISGTTLTVTGAGIITIAANQVATANYAAATTISRTVVVNQGAQFITFTAPVTPITYPVSAVTLVATSTVANPIVFSVVSGPGTISGTTLTVTGAGTIVIAANQPATANYLAAAQVTQTVVANLAVQSALVKFNASATLGSIKVVMLGATGLDFTFHTGGTCSIGTTYNGGQTCTVFYTFQALAPGQRLGAVQLFDNSASPFLRGSALISGASTGALPAFFPAVSGTITQSNPNGGLTGIAVDGAGSLYTCDGLSFSIAKMTLVSGAYVKTSIPSRDKPYSLQVDGNGSIYAVAYTSTGKYEVVKETPTTSGTYIESVLYAPGSGYVNSVGIDVAGNVYFASDVGIYKITSGGLSVVTTGNYFGQILVSPTGTIFTVDARGNGLVVSFTPSNGTYAEATVDASTYAPSLAGLDGFGNLYVQSTDINTSAPVAVMEIPAAGNTYKSVVIGSAYFYQVAVSGDGTVYSAQGDGDIHTLRYTGEQASFSSTAVGTTSSDSPRTQTLWNLGNGPLSLSIPSIGSNPSVGTANFSVVSSTDGFGCPITAVGASTAGTLAAGSYCDLSLSFKPTVSGTSSDTLTLLSNGIPSTSTVLLSGATLATSQTITFTVASPITFSTTPIALTGISTSGLALTYTVSGPATLSGNLLTLTGIGNVIITASQAGNASFSAANVVTATLVVMQGTQAITLVDPGPLTFVAGGSYALVAIGGGSGNAVICSVVLGSATINGFVVSYTSAGSIAITCNQAGNSQYASANAKNLLLTINKATPTITLPTLPLTVVYGAVGPINIAATSSAGLPVTASVLGAGSLNGNLLSVLGAGMIEIDYAQAATTNYLAALTSAFITSNPPAPITTDLTSAAMGVSVPIPFTMTFTQAFTAGTISILSQGAPGTPAVVTNTGTCSTGSSYAAGSSCTVNISFTPTGPGVTTTTVYLYDAAGNLQSAMPVTIIRYH